MSNSKKSLGVPRPKKSGSASASSSPKKAERPATSSRASAQPYTADDLVELFIWTHIAWCHKENPFFDEGRFISHPKVIKQKEFLRSRVISFLALGARKARPKGAVTAKRNGAKRTLKGTGRKATPKTKRK